MQDLTVFIRLVLASVFLTSAIAKIKPSPTFEKAIQRLSLGFVGSRMSLFVARVLPTCELVLALLLVAGYWLKVIAGIACLMLTLFTILMAVSLARGERFRCNCFGAMSQSEIGFGSLARNIILIAGGLTLVVVSPWFVSLPEVLHVDLLYLSDPGAISILMSVVVAYIVLLAVGEVNVLFHDQVAG